MRIGIVVLLLIGMVGEISSSEIMKGRTPFLHRLSNDFSNNKLRAASASPDDFICSTIKHKYDAVTKEDTWWDAEVIDVDIESEDKENPKFFILYKGFAHNILDLANVNDDGYFLEPLNNDYLNGWVKIVSVGTDPIKFWFLCFLWLILREICLLMPFEPLLREKGMVSVNTVSLDVFWWVLIDGKRVSSLSKY